MSAVDAVMDYCKQTARTINKSLLCWLYSICPRAYYIKPFIFIGKAINRKKYIRLLKRFITIIFCAYNLSADPDALAEALWQLTKCPAAVDAEDDLDKESINKEGHSKDNALSGYESSILIELIIEFSTKEVIDGRPASTLLVYFSRILRFSANLKGFLPARLYTSNLAALIYKIRQEYLVLGLQSPFEELFSLLAYGRAITSSETPNMIQDGIPCNSLYGKPGKSGKPTSKEPRDAT
ncbi:hypothetical protein IWW34DRAFT_804413 [Fusarium oxysporum f. sp. albedinis]|nr:hypothetical protein IWW34DRAFT_804413 [Fusarium oxysporum f. sp. albedinis]